MDRVSNRHEGDLGGRLEPFATSAPLVVAISVPSSVASEAACQHTAWMLLNLLARCEGIVERVLLACPPGVPLAGRIVPLAQRDLGLAEALLAGGRAIDAVPVTLTEPSSRAAIRLVVGPGEHADGWLRVHGEAWWGGIALAGIPGRCESRLPFGPYAAALLAVGEVFKAVRLRGYTAEQAVFYSLASFRAMSAPPSAEEDVGVASVDGLAIAASLAGVGAVGSAWVHAMWATEGIAGRAILADADDLGVDVTNLNRCLIFPRASIGKRKASEAAGICSDAPLEWAPYDGPIADAPRHHSLLISAVDTNEARSAIQGLYPSRLMSASTSDLRAEVLRCDPLAGSACLRCYNPIERGPSDDELRRRYLGMSADGQAEVAEELGLSPDEADQWAIQGVCGYAGDQIAAHLRPAAGPPAFAVGFVSGMAGVMLAAQTVKEVLGDGPLDGIEARAVMQFLDPRASLNRPTRYARDPLCPMCRPGSPAAEIWRRRYQSFRP